MVERRNPRVERAAFLLAAALALAGCGGGSEPGGAAGGGGVSYRPHRSQAALPFANGFAAAAYDLAPGARRVTTFRDHIYARKSATEPSKDFCQGLTFGYRRAGLSQWLSDFPEQEAGFVPGTGIVRTLQRAAGVAYECYYFAPMTGGLEQALVAIVRARNEGAAASDSALFVHLDFRLGGDADATAEWVWNYAPGAIMEGKEGTGNRLAYKALGPVAHWSAGNTAENDPYPRVRAGGHLTDQNDAATPVDDAKCGFESAIAGGGPFAPGAEAWFGVAVALREDGDEGALRAALDAYVGQNAPEALLAREIAFWQSWHAGETLPGGASPDELALLQQSTAVLKMAQCREPGGPNGQIVASLPPGQWNITWVRDACYAIHALLATGHLDEAKAALSFFLNGRAGTYVAEVGRRYRISVCRYTGDGVEESDDNGNGPNIELDDFGLFLGAMRAYVEASGDAAFLAASWPIVRDEVADVLVSLIDANDLIRADSSIWERHLWPAPNTPDGKKQFAYTSIQAVNGLRGAAVLARLAGDAARGATYDAAQARVADGIARELVLGDVLCSSVEEKALGFDFALDGSVADAIIWDVVAPDSPAARGTVVALERLRAFGLLSPGYLRNDDARSYGPDNWYDRQEWVFIDLRMASALARMGRAKDARRLLDWVTAQSRANFDLIAELYDEASADYRGAVPMVGFGAGAYILASFDCDR